MMTAIKRAITGIFFIFTLAVPSFAQDQPQTAPTPNAEQVMLYVEAINSTPATDRQQAIDVLNQWLNGELQMSSMEGAPEQTMGEGEYAACLAACCTFWGCNPICVAGCAALK